MCNHKPTELFFFFFFEVSVILSVPGSSSSFPTAPGGLPVPPAGSAADFWHVGALYKSRCCSNGTGCFAQLSKNRY